MPGYKSRKIFLWFYWLNISIGISIPHRLIVCIWFPRDTRVLTLDSVEVGGVPSAKLHAIPPLVCSIDFLVLVWKPVPSAAAQESRQLDHEVHGPQWQFTEKSHLSYIITTLPLIICSPGHSSSQDWVPLLSAKSHAVPPFFCSIDFLDLILLPVPSAAAQELVQLDHGDHIFHWQSTEKSNVSHICLQA